MTCHEDHLHVMPIRQIYAGKLCIATCTIGLSQSANTRTSHSLTLVLVGVDGHVQYLLSHQQ
jgi:hypothetical protein